MPIGLTCRKVLLNKKTTPRDAWDANQKGKNVTAGQLANCAARLVRVRTPLFFSLSGRHATPSLAGPFAGALVRARRGCIGTRCR